MAGAAAHRDLELIHAGQDRTRPGRAEPADRHFGMVVEAECHVDAVQHAIRHHGRARLPQAPRQAGRSASRCRAVAAPCRFSTSATPIKRGGVQVVAAGMHQARAPVLANGSPVCSAIGSASMSARIDQGRALARRLRMVPTTPVPPDPGHDVGCQACVSSAATTTPAVRVSVNAEFRMGVQIAPQRHQALACNARRPGHCYLRFAGRSTRSMAQVPRSAAPQLWANKFAVNSSHGYKPRWHW